MRSFKKIAAMIMAVAMLCSFTALAADPKVTLDIATEVNSDNPEIALNYESTASQTTMLVYKGESDLAGADVVYINQFAENADPVTLDLAGAESGTYTVVAGGMDVAEADTKTFTFTNLVYDVTLTKTEGGVVTKDYAGNFNGENTLVGVPKGTKIVFGFEPFVGYKVTAVTINGEAAPSVVPTTGGTIEVEVDGAKTIAVTFEKAEQEENAQSFTSADIYDVPASAGAEDEKDQLDSKLVFGKAIAPNGGVIKEAGMYLEKLDVADTTDGPEGTFKPFVAQKTGVGGPFFAAATRTADDKYGIRFFRFEKGTYRVKSYVKYGDAETDVAYGAPVVFEVR